MRLSMQKLIAFGLLAFLLAWNGIGSPAKAQTELVIYSAMEPDEVWIVPALVTSPETLREQPATSSVQLAGIVMPAAKENTGHARIKTKQKIVRILFAMTACLGLYITQIV